MTTKSNKWTDANTLDVIKTFFEFQIDLKMYHWMTRTYSRHIASDELTGKCIKLIDRFVEVYIGHHGRCPSSTKNVQALGYRVHRSDVEMCDYLRAFTEKINGWKNLHADLENIRDELVEAIYQALYLFTLS